MPLQTFIPPIPPSKSDVRPEFKILEAEFGDGYTQSVPDGLNHIRDVANLSWDALTPAQADTIETFIRNHGGTTPFLYTLSDSATQRQWVCKEFSRTRGTPNKVTATFRQDFSSVA